MAHIDDVRLPLERRKSYRRKNPCLRGDIYWVDFTKTCEPAGFRPALVVSQNGAEMVEDWDLVSVAAITGSTESKFRAEVTIHHRSILLKAGAGACDGLPGLSKDSLVRCLDLGPIGRDQVHGQLGKLSHEDMVPIDDTIRHILQIGGKNIYKPRGNFIRGSIYSLNISSNKKDSSWYVVLSHNGINNTNIEQISAVPLYPTTPSDIESCKKGIYAPCIIIPTNHTGLPVSCTAYCYLLGVIDRNMLNPQSIGGLNAGLMRAIEDSVALAFDL